MMIYKRKGFGLTLALAFVLAGCMGSGGGGGAGGPTIDMTAVGSGGGTSEADAYLLPGTMPAGTNGDMKDYFAQGGYWQVGYSKLQKDVFTNASYRSTFGSMYYNADADQWVLYVNSAPYTLSDNGAGIYESSSGCYLSTSACTAVDQYDDATKDMYGTFANAMHYDGSYKASFITAHYGMLTADMPAGSATFNGVFEGAANDQTTFYAATGTVTISADFDTTDITLTGSGSVGSTGSFTLSGTGTISGNAYTGTTTAAVTFSSTHTEDATYSGTMDGAFYGPSAVQTAGAVEAISASASTLYMGAIPIENNFVGGYWAEKQ